MLSLSPDNTRQHKQFIERIRSGNDFTQLTSRERFQFDRLLGIGGSDAGAICGCSPFSSAYDVWCVKTGRTPFRSEENAAMHFGTILEPVVRDEYAAVSGNTVDVFDSPFIHPQWPFLRANVDGLVIDKSILFEAKTARSPASIEWGASGTCIIPASYMFQLQFYLFVLNYRRADLAVLIGTSDFRIYHIDYHPGLVAMMLRKLHVFWFEHVIADIPPSSQKMSDITHRYPASNGTGIEADAVHLDLYTRYAEASRDKKQAEKTMDDCKLALAAFMGENEALTLDGKPLITYKSQIKNQFQQKTFQARHPDLYQSFTTEQSSRFFRLSKKLKA